MIYDVDTLWAKTNECLKANNAADAMCYLAEILSNAPDDRHARLSLAVALGSAGDPNSAVMIMRALAERLVHDGFMLPAIAVIRHGLQFVPDEPGLLGILGRLHVRGVRAKAGQLAMPPPLKVNQQAQEATTASELLEVGGNARLLRISELGLKLPTAGPAKQPQAMPLFCELDTPAFVETVKRLQYHRVPAGTKIIEEGASGDSLLILVSGQVEVSKGGTVLVTIGQGSVIGEMALITNAPRSATVTAVEPVEYLQLGRGEVADLSKARPQVLQELVAYCRRRLLLNLLRTSPLFTRFDEDTRGQLLGRFQTLTLQENEQVVTQGEPSPGLFVIATGRVQVHVANDDGESVMVATLGPGDVFGEISLLKDTPATAYVIAQETVAALALPSGEFKKLLTEYPQVREYLETLSADRLKASAEAVADSAFVDPDDIVVL